MRNTSIDGPATIREFAHNYYGPKSAWAVLMYMELMAGAIEASGYYLRFSYPVDAAFLTPAVLLEAARVLDAGAAAAGSRFALRLACAKLPVAYVAMRRWEELKAWAGNASVAWPFQATLREQYDVFVTTFNASGATRLDENGHDLNWLHALLFGSGRGSAGLVGAVGVEMRHCRRSGLRRGGLGGRECE